MKFNYLFFKTLSVSFYDKFAKDFHSFLQFYDNFLDIIFSLCLLLQTNVLKLDPSYFILLFRNMNWLF